MAHAYRDGGTGSRPVGRSGLGAARGYSFDATDMESALKATSDFSGWFVRMLMSTMTCRR